MQNFANRNSGLEHRPVPVLPSLMLGLAMIVFAIALVALVMETVSAGRAYIAAESYWSKAYQSVIFHLDEYAEGGDPERLRQAREALEVPLSGRRSRIAMEQADPDYETARQQMAIGGNHYEDASRMVFFYRFFRDRPYFLNAVQLWRESDIWVLRLEELSDELDLLYRETSLNRPKVQSIRTELKLIHATLGVLAEDFSEAIGEGSRRLSRFAVMIGIVAIVLFSILLSLVFFWALRGLRASQHLFWSSFEQAPVGMALVDSHGKLHEVNDALCDFLDRREEKVTGQALIDFCHPADRSQLRKSITDCLHGSGVPLAGFESRYLRAEGAQSWGKLSLSSLQSGKNGDCFHVAVLEDVSEARELSRKLAYQAAHDQLTGLANRREFERVLNQLLHEHDNPSTRHALAQIDLDQFKVINDSFGHLAGDALLVRLSDRMQQCLREGDLLARLDGDEFGVILKSCSIETATAVAHRLRDTISEFRFRWEERSINVNASIGIVEIDGQSQDATLLMQRVDLACHEAKDLGRNQVFVHSPQLASSLKRQEDMDWVHRINEALGANLFRIHGQLLASASGKEWRCELLLRLVDKQGNLYSASEFMDAAERYHVARTLDRWVVEHAIEHIVANQSRLSWIKCWHINLSGQSVDCDSVLPEMIEQIQRQRIDPKLLCFEITESAAIHSLEEAKRFFSALRDLGCEVALDDFGKGLSTFDYLKQLPIDMVKIDGGFVRELAHSELDHAMVRSIHEVARVAGKRTVAESVESIELVLKLRQIGIDFMQGYAIHNPAPLDQLVQPQANDRPVDIVD
ncbi:MAG: EAL domain-containing protein [Wenzhouxiangellaceae bacterium]|nr:EAL domain-containing protein [Wenzhouxiangellaceae bacterium]